MSTQLRCRVTWQGGAMAILVTIGYGDQDGYDRTLANVKQAAHAHDDSLRHSGAVMGVAGDPVQVRNPNASGVTTTDGPFQQFVATVESGRPVRGAGRQDRTRAAACTLGVLAQGSGVDPVRGCMSGILSSDPVLER